MKKLLMVVLMALTVVGLTACAELPKGVDQNFHERAYAIFTEVDDDTMELDWEGTDADDQANVNMVTSLANSEREIAFVNALNEMVKLQEGVINGEQQALTDYLKQRNIAMDTMNFGDEGDSDEFEVPAFNFGEEE